MDAVPEGEVRVGPTMDVEPVRIGELRRIPIGGGDPQQDDLVGGDHVSAKLHRGGRPPAQSGERRSIAQHFLDRGREAGRIRAQRRRGGRMCVEGDDGVCNLTIEVAVLLTLYVALIAAHPTMDGRP